MPSVLLLTGGSGGIRNFVAVATPRVLAPRMGGRGGKLVLVPLTLPPTGGSGGSFGREFVVWTGCGVAVAFGVGVGVVVAEPVTVGGLVELMGAVPAGWPLESSPAMKSNLRPGSGTGF